MSSIIRRRTVMKYSRFPSDFHEVEWIQSSGTQWIDTDIKTDLTLEINIKFNGIAGGKVYGSYGCLLCIESNDIGWSHNSDTWSTRVSGNWSNENIIANVNNSRITLNEVTSLNSQSGESYSPSYAISIFALHGTSISDYSSTKLYYMSMKKSGVFVRKYIPCYCTKSVTAYKGSTATTASSGTIGMYDMVNNRFYINSGTGTFTKGPDV